MLQTKAQILQDTQKIYRIACKATLCYLLLPLILWAAFWIRPLWAILFTSALVSCGVLIWRRMGEIETEEGENNSFNWKCYLITLLPLLVLSCVAGIGGLGPQEGDWFKHNSILYDLSTRHWPVVYDDWNGDFNISRPYLSFYLAYYLPAAFLSKLFPNSVEVANWLLLLWTQFGLCLFAFWLIIMSRSTKWWLGLAFCMVGGFQHWVNGLFDFLHISTHVLRLQYEVPNALGLLSWVPHHALAAYLGVPFLLGHFFRPKWKFSFPALTFWWTIIFAWSPFVAIGCLPWLLFGRTKISEQLRTSSRSEIWLGATAFAWLGLQTIYFAQRVPIVRLPEYFPENSFLPWKYIFFMQGWFKGLVSFFFRYGFMVVLVWGIPAFFLWKWNANRTIEPSATREQISEFVFKNANRIILMGCGTVFVLGLFRMGIANDLFIRGVIGPHLALFLLGIWLWNHANARKHFRVILVVGALLSSFGPVRYFLKRTTEMAQERRIIYRPSPTENISLANPLTQVHVRRQQYLGLPNSVFARYFLKDERPSQAPITRGNVR